MPNSNTQISLWPNPFMEFNIGQIKLNPMINWRKLDLGYYILPPFKKFGPPNLLKKIRHILNWTGEGTSPWFLLRVSQVASSGAWYFNSTFTSGIVCFEELVLFGRESGLLLPQRSNLLILWSVHAWWSEKDPVHIFGAWRCGKHNGCWIAKEEEQVGKPPFNSIQNFKRSDIPWI